MNGYPVQVSFTHHYGKDIGSPSDRQRQLDLSDNVDVPNSVTHLLNRTLIFDWCASNNGHQKDMCLKDIRLHVLNIG